MRGHAHQTGDRRSERPARVLLLTADYPPGVWSGIGASVESQATALAQAGADVHVLVASAFHMPTATADGPVLHRLAGPACPVDPRTFDCVHLHSLALSELALEMRRRFAVKLAYTAHSIIQRELADGPSRTFWSRVQLAVMRASDHVLFLSESERECALELAPDLDSSARLHVIGNGIAPSPAVARRPGGGPFRGRHGGLDDGARGGPDWDSRSPCDGPRGVCDGPRGVCDGPRGVCDGSRGPCDGPHGACDGPRGVCDGPRGVCDGSRGPCDGPHGACDGGRGVCDGPHGVCDGSRGPCDGPHGACDGGRGVCDGPHGAADWDSGGARGGPVVFAGRFTRNKGLPLLLDVLPRMAAGRDLRFVLAGGHGDDSCSWELTRLRAALGGACEMPGWLSRVRLRALFTEASLVLVPSQYEPFGMVALEAMAAGAPVLAARAGGLAEVVRPGSGGELAESRDPEEWRARAAAILSDDARWSALHERGPRFAAENFDIRRVAGRLMGEVYGR
jgi:glycosyltransferase involved in cell wall biosynthesis